MIKTDRMSEMLYLCLEMEGLVSLASRRSDSAPDEVFELLVDKARRLYELAQMSAQNAGLDVSQTTNRETPVSEKCSVNDDKCNEAESELFEVKEDADIPSIPTASVIAVPGAVQHEPSSHSFTFTLNDRFRFIRELFDGEVNRFDEAIEVLRTMDSKDEMRDYLVHDLCLDPNYEALNEFVEILSK